jgi:Leucine-rich repeat (LRR) protein
MTSLQYLYVENNPNLTTLPKELASLPNLKQLRIKNTGIKSLPPELMNSTNPAIQAAVKSLAANPS